MTLRLQTLCAAALLFSACRTESISSFATSEVTADITATATGRGSTEVSATFRKGQFSLTFLQLTADDKVEATSGTTTKRMTESTLLGLVTYSAGLPVDSDGAQFAVALTRAKDSNAPSSVATLPQGFTLTPVGGSFSRGTGGPTFGWSSSTADPMILKVAGDCIDTHIETLPSSGATFTLGANTLKKRAVADGGAAVADDCTATATVDRSRAGTLDPAYANGSVAGVQRRQVSFTTTP